MIIQFCKFYRAVMSSITFRFNSSGFDNIIFVEPIASYQLCESDVTPHYNENNNIYKICLILKDWRQ